jgi:hypothetical protein
MEFGALKMTSGLSGKKWDKAMKNLSSLGLTEVVVEGDLKELSIERVIYFISEYQKGTLMEFFIINYFLNFEK